MKINNKLSKYRNPLFNKHKIFDDFILVYIVNDRGGKDACLDRKFSTEIIATFPVIERIIADDEMVELKFKVLTKYMKNLHE